MPTSHSILIIDDEKQVCHTLARGMSDRGVEARHAYDSEQALRTLRLGWRPSFVALDLRLGQESGLEVLVKLKRLDPSLPVVMMSGFGSVEDGAAAIRLGAFGFLDKPLLAGDLLAEYARFGGFSLSDIGRPPESEPALLLLNLLRGEASLAGVRLIRLLPGTHPFLLLTILARSAGKVVTKAALHAALAPNREGGVVKTAKYDLLTVIQASFRAAGRAKVPEAVAARGGGYALVVEVRVIE